MDFSQIQIPIVLPQKRTRKKLTRHTLKSNNSNSALPKRRKIADPPKPAPPKQRGSSHHQTLANLHPSILANIGGTDAEFLQSVYEDEDAEEVIINGDGVEYQMNKKLLLEKINDKIGMDDGAYQDDEEADQDDDLRIIDDAIKEIESEKEEDEEQPAWVNLKITEFIDTKGKHWKQQTGEIDRLIYCMNKAFDEDTPAPLSGSWWEVVHGWMMTTREWKKVKAYFDRTVKNDKGGYGWSVLCKLNTKLKGIRSKQSASRS